MCACAVDRGVTERAGTDEAGKGPALGPMVAAAVRSPPEALPDGVDDSKRLPAERRERLAERLREDDRIAVATAVVEPSRIDDPETDMNSLTVAAHVEALEAVLSRDGAVEVLLDAADVDPERFARRVGTAVDGVDRPSRSVRAEHGADETDAVVGAASVVAKVARDRRIAAIDGSHDRPVGSGYPSDPTTREFLRTHVREHGELPAAARESWTTCRDALAAVEQSDLDEF